MRKSIALLATIAVASVIIFWIDPMIIEWAKSLFPPSAKDWMKIITIILWILLLAVTGGFTLAISAIIGFIVSLFVPVKVPDDEGRSAMFSNKKQSAFQQRLEQAKRKREQENKL